MDVELQTHLREWAVQYEKSDFLKDDPSQFMHRYKTARDIEIAGFFAAALAFGRRTCILNKVGCVLDAAGESPANWILSRGYDCFFPDSDASFYRVFTYRQLRRACETLRGILQEHGTLGEQLKQLHQSGATNHQAGRLASVLAELFPAECAPLVPHGSDTANKRLNLYLRWMVRGNSEVDMGLWTWYPASELIMPLDVHVVQMSKELGLLPPNATASLCNALRLTEALKEIYPDDPVRGDYALFGYGVNS
ncbi:MAG: TIGR02757 family protein [Lentisphaeria bacterium]|nr:TIGR02757 family protein [Lentisphaeria bacterium]